MTTADSVIFCLHVATFGLQITKIWQLCATSCKRLVPRLKKTLATLTQVPYLKVVVKMDVYGPADATATPSSLARVKSRMTYLSGAGLPRLSWRKGH